MRADMSEEMSQIGQFMGPTSIHRSPSPDRKMPAL